MFGLLLFFFIEEVESGGWGYLLFQRYGVVFGFYDEFRDRDISFWF